MMQRRRRGKVKLVIMSATLDVGKFSGFLEECSIAYVQVLPSSYNLVVALECGQCFEHAMT